MSNLQLSYPSIPLEAIARAASVSFDEDFAANNLITGPRFNRAKLTAGSSGVFNTEYDLGVGNSKAADHVIVADAAILVAQGTTGLTLATSPTGIGGSYTDVWTDAGFARAQLYGPNAQDYIRHNEENLLIYTGDLSTGWTKINGVLTGSLFANPVNGSIDAQEWNPSDGASSYLYQDGPVSFIAGVVYIGSIYVRLVSANFFSLRLYDGTAAKYVGLNVTNGVTSADSGASATAENLGGGWFRFNMTYTATATGLGNILVALSDTDRGVVAASSAARGYFYGPQLRRVGTLSTYVNAGATPIFGLATNCVTPARSWRTQFSGGSNTSRSFSKLYFGTSFDPGVNSDSYSFTRLDSPGQFIAGSGSVYLYRLDDGRYSISITWDGVSTAKLFEFFNKIARYWQVHKYFLFTIAEHKLLDFKRLLHVEIVDEPQHQASQVADNYHTITVNFREVLG